eukprot:g11488.t1
MSQQYHRVPRVRIRGFVVKAVRGELDVLKFIYRNSPLESLFNTTLIFSPKSETYQSSVDSDSQAKCRENGSEQRVLSIILSRECCARESFGGSSVCHSVFKLLFVSHRATGPTWLYRSCTVGCQRVRGSGVDVLWRLVYRLASENTP